MTTIFNVVDSLNTVEGAIPAARQYRLLFDSGASDSIISPKIAKYGKKIYQKNVKNKKIQWKLPGEYSLRRMKGLN